MATLLMLIDGPMQSWGTQSNFGHRDTGLEPSKSGIIGLVGAALGRPRDADISDLAALRMGVRVEKEGVVQRDFHTAGRDGYYKVGGGIERNNVIVSDRYYLADARFLVGLEGEIGLLETIYAALRAPVFPLFLGRKAFIPASPPWLEDGLRDETLEEALCSYDRPKDQEMRLILEDPTGTILRRDQPISFAERRFLTRRVKTDYCPPMQQEEET